MRHQGTRCGALFGVAALVAALSASTPSSAAPTPNERYAKAIADARAGRFDSALPALQRLVREHPSRADYRLDLIVVLSWAERHADALAASRTLKLDADTPDYALAAIGHAALHGQQARRAAQAYGLLVTRKPANADARLGYALALLESHQAARADQQLQLVLRLAERNAGLLRSAFDALAARSEEARAEPFARRLTALGQAPQRVAPAATSPIAATTDPREATPPATASPAQPQADAAQTAPAAPDFEAQLQRHAASIRAASAWLDRDYSPARYRLMDEALAENARLAEQVRTAGRPDLVKRLRQDRVQALRDRGDMAGALAEFRELDAGGEPVPPYVLRAAADAALALREPELARRLYQRALTVEPTDTSTYSGLLYANLESEDFASLDRDMAAWLTQSRQAPAARQANVTALRFANRLDAAQAALDSLATEQPTSTSLWLEQGELLAQRGLPRAAEERFKAVLAAEPGHLRARIGLANAQWAAGDIIAAGHGIEALHSEAPEHPAVQRLMREWTQRSAWTLSSSTARGFGQGLVAGNNDLQWDTSLQSGQSAEGWRTFANHQLATARFGGSEAQHERLSAGLEWSRRDLQISAELGQDLRNARSAVWAAGLALQRGDHWSWRLRHESQTNDFPLKARQPGAESDAPTYLHASRTVLGGAYRWNETRRLAADLSSYDFNDGNRRRALAISWLQRLQSNSDGTLDLSLGGYGSSNSLPDRVYFSPQRDLAVSATLAADWLTWRRYERSFNQRLSLSVGNYRQTSEVRQGSTYVQRAYGWRPFQELRYEHEWQWTTSGALRYGLGWRRFAYDGVYESKAQLSLNAVLRF